MLQLVYTAETSTEPTIAAPAAPPPPGRPFRLRVADRHADYVVEGDCGCPGCGRPARARVRWILTTRRRWRRRPESADDGWYAQTWGPLVVACRVAFL